MSARDHSAGREVVHLADECLQAGGKVEIFLRARQESMKVSRFNLGQFSVRLFTENGVSYDVAYSAIEAAKYLRPSKVSIADV